MTVNKTNIITLICNKGGVGRSTTAINYAWSLAIKDKKVLVCDLDAQANASSTLALDYGTDVVDRGKNMTNLLKSSGEGALDFIVDTRNENIKLLASTLVLDSTEGEVKSFLDLNIFKLFDHMFNNKLKEEFDYIIFDTPPLKSSVLTLNALLISNWYWYILSAEDQWSFDARIVTEKIMKDVRKLNRKIKPLPVLLTKYISSSSQSVQMKKAALKAFKSSIVKTPITYSTVVAKSHSKRKSIHESSPNHQIAKEYDKVAESISNFINKKKK